MLMRLTSAFGSSMAKSTHLAFGDGTTCNAHHVILSMLHVRGLDHTDIFRETKRRYVCVCAVSHMVQTRADLMWNRARRMAQLCRLPSAIAFVANTLAQKLGWCIGPLDGWNGHWLSRCRKCQDFAQVDPILII